MNGSTESSASDTGWTSWVALGVVLAAGVAAYSGASGNQFVFDDAHTVVHNPSVTSWSRAGDWFSSPYATSSNREYVNYRPVLMASYALDHALWGPSPTGFHVTNAAIHVSVVVFVFVLGRRVMSDPWAAVGAAGVFALHPINAEAVNYVSARSSSLVALWVLAAVWADARAESSGTRGWRVGRYLLGAAALGTKEAAVVLPLLVLFWRRAAKPEREPWSVSWKRSSPWWVLTAGYVGIRAWMLSGVMERAITGPDATGWQGVLFALKIYAASLGHWLWPSGLAVDHAWPSWIGPSEGVGVATALALALAATAALCRRNRSLGMHAVWFWVAILPSGALGFVSRVVLYQDNRVYLAGVGLAWLAGRGIAAGLRWAAAGPAIRRVGAVATLAVAVGCATDADRARTAVWRDRNSLWDDVLAKYPASAMANNGKGLLAFEAGRVDEAREWFQRTVTLSPGFAAGHKNLGITFARLREWDRAAGALQRALSINPGEREARINLGKVYEHLGRPELALEEYRRLVRDDPEQASVWARIGWILALEGRVADAAGHFERGLVAGTLTDDDLMTYGTVLLALERWGDAERVFEPLAARHPTAPQPQFNLAAALDGAGAWDRAVDEYRLAAELDPGDPDPFFRIGVLYGREERWQEADAAYREALARAPDFAAAHANAGLVAERRGDRGGAIAHYVAVLQTPPSGPDDEALRDRARTEIARLRTGAGPGVGRVPEGTKSRNSRSSTEGVSHGGG